MFGLYDADSAENLLNYNALRAAARQRVVECCEVGPERDQILKDPFTLTYAFFVWKDQPTHQRYWNNRFVVAVMCEMPEFHQRLAAWCLLSNARHKYFEWWTHSGYDMAAVFRFLGMDVPDIERERHGYTSLEPRLCRDIARIFKLPASSFVDGTEFSEKEIAERHLFSALDPYWDSI